MINKTILDALNMYKIHIQCGNGNRTKKEVDSILERIESYEEYINQGGKIDGTWLENNYQILSKAIKHTYDFIAQSDEMNEEHQILNRFMQFYMQFYKQHGIDLIYMSI